MKTPSWSIVVPVPPGVNQLYVNRSKSGMRGRMVSPAYALWRGEAEAALWQAGELPRFSGKVGVCMSFQETKGLADVDGKIKACLDYLVRAGIIRGDDRRYVRMVMASWDAKQVGARITVTDME